MNGSFALRNRRLNKRSWYETKRVDIIKCLWCVQKFREFIGEGVDGNEPGPGHHSNYMNQVPTYISAEIEHNESYTVLFVFFFTFHRRLSNTLRNVVFEQGTNIWLNVFCRKIFHCVLIWKIK